MYLHDIMRICLLALNTRYPEHSVDIDAQVCGLPEIPEKRWKAIQVIELFDDLAPHLLIEPASLYITDQRCAIFLPRFTRERPAIVIHCRGKIPASQYSLQPPCKSKHGHLSTAS